MSLIQDLKYSVVIDNGGQTDNIVIGFLPERFDLDITSDWDTPLAPGAANGYLGALVRFGLAEAGVSAINKYMTVALWSGVSPINVNIPITFIADSPGESITKVVKPIKNLMKMALPNDLSNGFLQPPGPKPDGGYASEKLGITGGENITVRIGEFISFYKVIIQSVSPSFDMILDSRGIPMRASVNLRFRTYNSPTKQELDTMFRV
jgi:hypothetical protein